ncbi:PqiC family protein [Marichromatium gracile]|uniref:PqiC family protein n=1 Tax=Marichromatium gracile TaxID=1048 RepID=UPI001F2C30A1|nr:PqiC family protein [Marichromatium gracile]MCF1183719.1 PqiC family protein [Marichromatium gracile]
MTQRRWRLATVALVAAVSAGCASSPPARFYALSAVAVAPPEARAPGLAVGVGPLVLPEYLDRAQLVTRESGNRLRIDEFERWGGSLRDDFLRVWSENLARALGSERVRLLEGELRYGVDLRVGAELLAFEGNDDGSARLKVRWAVRDGTGRRTLLVRESDDRQPVAAPGDSRALVAALDQLLARFSAEVAGALAALPPTPPETADQAR